MKPETIAERIRAIRWPKKDFSAQTGLTEMTVLRTLRIDTSPLQTTIDAMSGALIAEELRLRDYLNALHPPAATVVGEAA